MAYDFAIVWRAWPGYPFPPRQMLLTLYGFIKKSSATPEDDLELMRSRTKELER